MLISSHGYDLTCSKLDELDAEVLADQPEGLVIRRV